MKYWKGVSVWMAIIIVGASLWSIDTTHKKWRHHSVLNWDVFGYYNYLPAAFIYQDLKAYDFLDSILTKYNPVDKSRGKYGLHPTPKEGFLCNQYPVGVSILQSPGFFIAHAFCLLKMPNSANGYSSPYQHSVVLTTLLFACLSSALLMVFLMHYFDPMVALATVLLLMLGTNVLEYASNSSGFAHVYQFFFYSAVLLLTQRWYISPHWLTSTFLGICIGLAIISRPTDIFIAFIPLFWNGISREKWSFLYSHLDKIITVIVATFLMCSIQMIYWKYAAGQWIYFSYSTSDYFQFKNFRVVHGLFSYRKGWFVYTPLAFIGFLSLRYISTALSFYKKLFWIYFIPMIYIVFSWHNWYYGWSFGCRALIGSLPLLALPIASWIHHIKSEKIGKHIAVGALLSFFVFLNVFQTWQYHKGMIHGTHMSEAVYWKIFLKTKRPENLERYFSEQKKFDWNTDSAW